MGVRQGGNGGRIVVAAQLVLDGGRTTAARGGEAVHINPGGGASGNGTRDGAFEDGAQERLGIVALVEKLDSPKGIT